MRIFRQKRMTGKLSASCMFSASVAGYFRYHSPAQGWLCIVMSFRPARFTNLHAVLINAVDLKLTERERNTQ
jgi:hypothetical protein